MTLCTKCHTVIRPVVAIDIDGTMGDYHGHFLLFAGSYMDTYFDPNGYYGDKELHEYMGLPLEVYREIKLAYRQGGGKRMMPLVPGAKSLIGAALAMDAEIWVTTTRPYNKFDSTDPDTRFWLRKHGLHFDHLLYHEDKYTKLAECVDSTRVVAVIDDLTPQLDSARDLFGYSVPFQAYSPYNIKNRYWVGGSLQSAANFVTTNIRKWRLNYA